MKVLKFGGTSVGSAAAINQVISIIGNSVKKGENPIVVVSAFKGITNLLLEAGSYAAKSSQPENAAYNKIIEIHSEVIRDLIPPKFINSVMIEIIPLFTQLKDLLYGIHLLQEFSPKSSDWLVSFGERLSARIISQALSVNGIEAQYFDSRDVIITDNSFGSAKVDFDKTNKFIWEKLSSNENIQVVTGFISKSESGETTTLGRGGSDYTASIIGAALKVDEIEIWTDVDGFMTADPGLVPGAVPIDSLTYDEAFELTHYGANVVYPPTVKPACHALVPIVIRNTFNPGFLGTVIKESGSTGNINITGVTLLTDLVLLKLEGNEFTDSLGVTGRVYSLLARNKVEVVLASQASAGNSISLCIHSDRALEIKAKIEEELRYELHFGQIKSLGFEQEVSLIAVITENLRNNSTIPGRIFDSLGRNGVDILSIAQGASMLNLSLVVSKTDEVKALNVIHDAFVSDEDRHKDNAEATALCNCGLRYVAMG
ncbi:MAG: aspartate kinase [Ignavibacteriales bacterium]|nr:aspartate kinase [Ignavibacteriales bacterium]